MWFTCVEALWIHRYLTYSIVFNHINEEKTIELAQNRMHCSKNKRFQPYHVDIMENSGLQQDVKITF